MSRQLKKYYDLRAKCIMDGAETDLLIITRRLVADELVAVGALCDRCEERTCRGCFARPVKRELEKLVKAEGFALCGFCGDEYTIVRLNRQGCTKKGGITQ